jgi:hypothetical protein
MFAVENALQGDEVGDDYSAGDRVQFEHYGPGDEIAAWLAQGESVSNGTALESAGDGTLQASSSTASEIPGSIIAIAREVLDLGTSGLSATRCRIEII